MEDKTLKNGIGKNEYTYFQIHKQDKEAFRALAPQDLLDQIDKKDGVYGIGAAKTDEGVMRPVGVLLFSLDGEDDIFQEEEDVALWEEDEDERKDGDLALREERCVRHMWINVHEESRSNGIGTGLVDHFIKSLVRLVPCRVIIDIPKGNDREWMLLFYGKFSFLFFDSLVYEFTATLKDLVKPEALAAEEEEDGVYAATEFIQALHAYLGTLSPKRRRKILPKFPFLDLMVSVVAFEEEKPVGCFLVMRHASGTLEPALLEVSEGKEEWILPMLRETLRLARYRYKGNASVHIRCEDVKRQMLCDDLYPGLHPKLYWHGECLVRINEGDKKR